MLKHTKEPAHQWRLTSGTAALAHSSTFRAGAGSFIENETLGTYVRETGAFNRIVY